MSLMVELIAGPLIGEMTSRQIVATGIADIGPPPGGELILALDPTAFGHDAGALGERLLADFAAEPGLRMTSARRYAARAQHQGQLIEVPAALLAEIEALCG